MKLVCFVVWFSVEHERKRLLERLLDASPGEDRTELFLDMCYWHCLGGNEVDEAHQKKLKKISMGQSVQSWYLARARGLGKEVFDGGSVLRP
jgi:hypothetical protein